MSGLPTWVYTFVIVTVVPISLGLNVADAFIEVYEVPDLLNVALGSAIGGALGPLAFKKGRGDDA